MAQSSTMTVRLDKATRLRLERLARATSRTKAFIAQEAIRDYVALNEWQIDAVEHGLADAEAGRLVEHEVVSSWLQSWGSKREKRRPK